MKLLPPSLTPDQSAALLKQRDWLVLTSAAPHTGARVERDAAGKLVAFEVLREGENDLTLDGMPMRLLLTGDELTRIRDYHQTKGVAIPLDCEHHISHRANEAGVDETDLMASEPLLGEKACAGYVNLELRKDYAAPGPASLWARVTKLVPRAAALLSGKADKMYGYFSPALRGLQTGQLRITAIALTDHPALNNLDLLAATGESKPTTPPTKEPTPMRTIAQMIPLLALAVGADAALFTEANAADLMHRAAERLKAQADEAKAFLAAAKDFLALTDADNLNTAAGKLLALQAKVNGDAALLSDLRSKVAASEASEKVRLLDTLAAEDKLTPTMRAWAEKQDMALLTDWSKTLSPVAQSKRLVGDPPKQGKGVVTAEARNIANQIGVKPEDLF